ncbi:BNR repeat protein [Neolewinella xylanilytica]|uniref:BNR repeat protein n=1 Tax=Neolewinella xylanilytica TaxID=1514080 RepID=A0A2S6I6N7_9BACT|nr:sialidase family protein [Neolewinella xylanilytica]PPK87173.1 BNR repeat protein [Neolewinella xylanilytica]
MLLPLLCLTFVLGAQDSIPPFSVDPLYDFDQPETLGLPWAPGVASFTVFSPGDGDNTYNHGVVLFPFRGMLYAQWQSSSVDEDGPDTRVFYSRSPDGENWTPPTPLTEVWDQGITTSGGWWTDGDTLVAYISVWPDHESGPKQGHTEFRTSIDGEHWSAPEPVTYATGQPVPGVIEQDVRALPSGRLLTAFHLQPGLIATPFYTDDPLGATGWRAGQMQNVPTDDAGMSREIEPSWFYRSDSAVVMVFRDQAGTFQKLAAVSHDRGETWTQPVLVAAPDSRAKQSAGNLPDGTAFMVNNPSGSKSRIPLVITLSADGFVFDRAYLLRSGGDDLPPQRYPGRYKRAGYSYPKSVLWGDYLYVGYGTNKEVVEVTRMPVGDLRKE